MQILGGSHYFRYLPLSYFEFQPRAGQEKQTKLLKQSTQQTRGEQREGDRKRERRRGTWRGRERERESE